MHNKKLLLPVYHSVSNKRLPHLANILPCRTVEQFEKDLDFFERYFVPISLNDLIKHLFKNAALPERSFLISFDDGYREIAEVVAPILKKRNIPAAFFLSTAFVDNKEMFFRNKASLVIEKLNELDEQELLNRFEDLVEPLEPTKSNIISFISKIKYTEMKLIDIAAQIAEVDFNQYLTESRPYINSDEIRDLIELGFIIGAHSVDHPRFNDISREEQFIQITNSLWDLKRWFSIEVDAFAFPFEDEGITMEIFEQVFRDDIFKISFGTSGFSKGNFFNNLQRQVMECGGESAEAIYKKLFYEEQLKRIKTRVFGK